MSVNLLAALFILESVAFVDICVCVCVFPYFILEDQQWVSS